MFVEKTAEGKALQRALLQYYEPRNAEKVIKALKMTHREDLIPLLVPAEGRIAVQRSARRAEAADVTIHGDGTYTVRPRGKGGKLQSRSTAPAGRSPDVYKRQEKRYTELMMRTGELVMDVGTVLDGRKAVREKLIDELGGLSDALAWLYREIEGK